MTLERQRNLVRRDAAAVVRHPYRGEPAVPYLDADNARARIQ